MRKIFSLIISVSILSICVSACANSQTGSMVKAKRRFAKYVEPSKGNEYHKSIDLSDGKKFKVNDNFGPKNIDFDIKIEDPY